MLKGISKFRLLAFAELVITTAPGLFRGKTKR
jgi:hypothetical protein